MSDIERCIVCGTEFEPRFSFQVQHTAEGEQYFCSQACHEKYLFSGNVHHCSVCGTAFEQQFAYQQLQVDGEIRFFCSTACRERVMAELAQRRKRMRRIAVLTQKGGTGKTTTSVNLAAGLAQMGRRVLLMDLDPQGNVAVSLGLTAQYTVYDMLINGVHPSDCIVQVSENLDALISNTGLAAAEAKLVNTRDRFKVLAGRMSQITQYDYAVMDCAPSISILNHNALSYADQILIPVSCDYLSLVGVKQILRTVKKVNETLLEPVSILGVVPTFYDRRTKISEDTVNTLRANFQDRVLPPIRANIKIKEAPKHKQTIFEYAPDSSGCQDYLALAQKVVELCEDGAQPEVNEAKEESRTPPPSKSESEPPKKE